MLAEWESQTAILIAWPHADTDWRNRLPDIDRSYTQLAASISRYQDAIICCRDAEHERHIRHTLNGHADSKRCHFYSVPYDDTWCRDYGPISLDNDGRVELVRFRFNGWGGRFTATRDDAVTARLHALGAFGDHTMVNHPQVAEGGSLETDGHGTIITTSRCLLARNRNGAVGKADIEELLRCSLAVERVLWLDHGEIPGDDTDGHVDMLVRFCDPRTLAYSQGSSTALRAFEMQLRSFRQADDSPYRLVPLPVPKIELHGQSLPASYANFLILNNAVIVPVYNQPEDSVARERLQRCFPDRKIIALDARALISQGGAVHCATMQLYC